MSFSPAQENIFMLEKIKCSRKIPQRWQNQGHLFSHSFEFNVEPFRVIQVLDSMRTDNGLEFSVLEGEVVDILNMNKRGNVHMFDDICIHAAAVGFPTANIKFPLPFPQDTVFEDIIT